MSDRATCRLEIKRAEGVEHRELACDPQQKEVLLSALENAGVKMPFGCRAGVCGSCLVLVVEGATNFLPADPIEIDTLDRCAKGPRSRLGCRLKLRAGGSGSARIEVPPEAESESIV